MSPMARSVSAPWVRTRLKAAPLTALLTSLLVLVTVFLAAALPRALDRGADQALRALLRHNGPLAASVTATSRGPGGRQTASGAVSELDHVAQVLAGQVRDPLSLADGGVLYGSRTPDFRLLLDAGLPRPDGLAPTLNLYYLHDAASHARLTAGRWPADDVRGPDMEVALAESTAATLGLHVGSVVNAGLTRPDLAGKVPPLQVQVVGLFSADDPASAFWSPWPCATSACLASAPDQADRSTKSYWSTSALISPGKLAEMGFWSGNGSREDDFRLPIRQDLLTADRAPALKRALASLTDGPRSAQLPGLTGRSDLRIKSPLLDLINEEQHRQEAAAPLTVTGPAGAAGVAVTVLCLAAALAAERRSAELRLLLARGGSRAGIAGRLLGEGAVTVVPAAVCGAVLALVLLPTPRWGISVGAAVAVALPALCAFPLRALTLLRPTGPRNPRRRLVAELAVLAVTVGAVVAVRRRGVAPADGGVDLLLVAAPLLLALTGALLLARCHPPALGGAARWARRRPGAVGFLGLARASRGSGAGRPPTVLPLLALLLAVTTAGFGATVLDSVAAGRARAARIMVGGDAKVTASTVPALADGFAAAASRLPGVRQSTAVWAAYDADLATADFSMLPGVTVVAVDPASYAAVARAIGVGAIDPALLASRSDGAVPALVTPDVAQRLDGETHDIHFSTGGTVAIRMAGLVNGTPAAPNGGAGRIVVVPVGPVAAKRAAVGHPNQWIGVGTIDESALRALLPAADPKSGTQPYLLRTSAAVVRDLADDPLQSTATRLFWSAVIAAGGFAMLSVLLTLVRAAPERAALLARLRTMGLRPRQGMALIIVEALPQALVAATAGGLLAAAAVPLLGPAVDLATMVGTTAWHAGLRFAVRPLLLQALGLAAVATLTVLVETAVSGRRQITTELRAGDER